MTTALVFGALLGLGLWLLFSALVPARVPLSLASQRLQREGRLAELSDVESEGAVARIGRWLLPLVGDSRILRPTTRADLAVVGRSAEEHVGRKCLMAIAGAVYVPLLAGFLQGTGFSLPFALPLWLAVASGVLGYVLPDVILKGEADERRRDFRHALGAFVDVMVMLLAANEGIEGALHLAADAGDGWAFAEIRKTLRDAQLQGETPWRALSRLGQEVGVPELVELSASAALAGSEGASVRRSLIAKAASIRNHAATEEEAEAQAASARMTLPMLVLLVGFILFIGYPAVTLLVEGV